MSHRRARPILPLFLLAATALTAACGADDAPTAAASRPGEGERAEPAVVVIERSRFEPATLTVPAGREITFRNLDRAAHTVTSPAGTTPVFDSGDLGEGEQLVVRVDEPGTYEYLCEIHPTMRGTVVVG